MPKTILLSIEQIKKDYPKLKFKKSADFYYSARLKTVFYNPEELQKEARACQLLHEIGHAQCEHHHYESGVQLLKMEAEAWAYAKKIANKYSFSMPEELIEKCLDTYRDWLHLRSTCPNCEAVGVEEDPYLYHCFNCLQKWNVPVDQRTRKYRHKLVVSK